MKQNGIVLNSFYAVENKEKRLLKNLFNGSYDSLYRAVLIDLIK
jgi:hypothetical protein